MALAESGKPQVLDDNSAHCAKQQSSYQAAVQDLQEVRDSAERSGMRLFLTDYHLESARLLLTRLIIEADSYSLKEISSKQQELKTEAIEHIGQASELIDETGYKRRTPELEYLQDCVAQIFG